MIPSCTRCSTRTPLHNPPYSKSVKSNIGGTFLRLIRKHFPDDSSLHKLFNKNTVKVSYSCTSNMASHINRHSASILQLAKPTEPCNCRAIESCPLKGECKATVQTTTSVTKSYIGSTATAFKTHYANHQSSMRHEKHANSTELAKHVWSLKRSGTDYEITWKIKARARSYEQHHQEV